MSDGSVSGSSGMRFALAQYGSLLPFTYLAFGGGGSTVQRINDFRNILANLC